MGSKGGFTLLGLLIILSVLCDSGHSLRCYNCPNAVGACTVATNCTANEDACLYVKAGSRKWWTEERNSKAVPSSVLGGYGSGLNLCVEMILARNSYFWVSLDTRTVYRCWKFENCKYKDVEKVYRGSHLKYECCQKDLCNRSGGTSITVTMALLVAPLLTAFWRLLI
ncbi:CD59 glycoprotein-like isoform X1 [Myotis daubentonii]|uniref:CD59 glycoprotein-like isoform X1 n=1 Tax=Myotis daubentonii TaxID=98922 RepID=UPI00287359FF|nr:CD59 glycoprotein-like isoform X1 [Myotis daubentonii]XP_059565720.1 CD59 glycoprotein-like isoform X1 [Myotis daubentonii]